MSETEIDYILKAAMRLNEGAQRLTFEKFKRIMRKTVGADKIYSERQYQKFQENPVAWLATRVPLTQSEEVLRAMN